MEPRSRSARHPCIFPCFPCAPPKQQQQMSTAGPPLPPVFPLFLSLTVASLLPRNEQELALAPCCRRRTASPRPRHGRPKLPAWSRGWPPWMPLLCSESTVPPSPVRPAGSAKPPFGTLSVSPASRPIAVLLTDAVRALSCLGSGWIHLLLQPRPFLAGSRRRAAAKPARRRCSAS